MIATAKYPPTVYPGVDRERLHRLGYTIVKRLFAREEMEALREQAIGALERLEERGLLLTEETSEGVARYSRCEVLGIPEVRQVALDARMVGVMSELLGGRPAYYGDSVLRMGSNGVRGWHRDCADRRRFRDGLDWHDPYPLLRCGLYMQDHAHRAGGLALRPRSHRREFHIRSLPTLVNAEMGDLVVWDGRTMHSGEVVRLRPLPAIALPARVQSRVPQGLRHALPAIPLPPRVQTRVPQALRRGEERERVVIFMSYALPGPHLDHYIEFLRTRKQNRELWGTSRFGPEVREQAKQAGLDVLYPIPEFGTPQEASLLQA